MSQSISQKLSSNKALNNYLFYCLSFVTCGLTQTCLGPIIPYFSELTNRAQTQYSVLFLTRSFGFVFGALLVKFLTQKWTYHHILMGTSTLILVVSIPFSLIFNLEFQACMIFFMTAGVSVLQIMVNLCILETQKDSHVQFWMLICHGMFGIGGLISPLLVYYFETNIFVLIALIYAAGIPGYYLLKSPQSEENQLTQELRNDLLDQMTVQQLTNPQERQQSFNKPSKNGKILSARSAFLLCVLFSIYVGMELGFGNWIPSYAVMGKIATKQEAINFSSLFWLAMTIFRFAAGCLPFNATKKMILLEFALIGSILASIFMISNGHVMMACYFGSFVFGICFSPMFPLMLTLQTDYNLEMTAKQNANCMLACSFGQGGIVMIIGYLMSWFWNDMLFYVLLGSAIVFTVVTFKLLKQYEKDQKTDENQSQIQLKEISKMQKVKI